MSFASDFGHDIPPDDWDGWEGTSSSSRKKKRYYSFTYSTPRTIYKIVQELVAETSKAYLFKFEEGNVWFPKSRVIYYQASNTISIPDWLWNRRKFISE
jgi:hypothetical protein